MKLVKSSKLHHSAGRIGTNAVSANMISMANSREREREFKPRLLAVVDLPTLNGLGIKLEPSS